MPLFLDLRPKQEKNVVIVEKIVLQKRSWYTETLKMLGVVALVTALSWGISSASNIAQKVEHKSFSAIGTISDISSSQISLDDATLSDGTNNTTYTFDTSNITKIETSNYDPLSLSDIAVGDQIIAQGISTNGDVEIKRIISLSAASTTATTTDPTATTTDITASTTNITASSTDVTSTSTDATTTPDVSTTTDDTSTTTDNVSTTTNDTSTSTDTTSTTTDATTTDNTYTTTPDVSTSTDTTSTSTDLTSTTTDDTSTSTDDTATSTDNTSTTTPTPPDDTGTTSPSQ